MRIRRALAAVVLAAAVLATSVAVADARMSPVRQAETLQRHLITSASASSAATSTASLTTTGAPVATRRVIVRLKDSATPQTLASLSKRVGASSGGAHKFESDRVTWTAPKGVSAERFAQRLQASGEVLYAVPDYQRTLTYTPPAYTAPDDPAITSPTGWQIPHAPYSIYLNGFSWWLREIHAIDSNGYPSAWAEGYTGPDIVGKYPLRASGSDITVAVLDSGLYGGHTPSHPDEGANIVGGHDFFEREDTNGNLIQDDDVSPPPIDSIPEDSSVLQRLDASHGTCVAGEIGMTVDNAQGSAGAGYDTSVVVHKVMGVALDRKATIDDAAVIEAIYYSVDHGAKVISMSFGGYDYSQPLADAISYAHARNVVVVAAKGNDGSGSAFYPADNNYVVSVGATDKDRYGNTVPASFSNYRATSRDIMAPGAFIYAPTEPGWDPLSIMLGESHPGYFTWDGTSMSTPIVAGSIAWLWRAAPALSADEIENVVFASATKHAATTHYPNGYRELNLYSAYKLLEAQYPLLTKPSITPATVASLGRVTLGWRVPLANQRGVIYNVSIDGSPVATSTGAWQGVFALGVGEHAVTANAHSAYNWDDGTAQSAATVRVVAPAAGPSAFSTAHQAGGSATALTVAYRQAVTLEATLSDASSTPLAGASVVLQSSRDGAAWSNVVNATELPGGVYQATVAPESRTYYRFASATSGDVLGAISGAASVLPGVALSTPASKSSVSHRVKLSVTGTIRPVHASSSRCVKLKFVRWNGHSWSTYGTAWTRVTKRTSYSSYAAKVRLRKGTYRIYAFTFRDSQHAATTTAGYKTVKVK